MKRADLDGSNIELLVKVPGFDGSGPTGGLALDLVGNKIYWTAGGPRVLGEIQRANLDGSNVEVVLGGRNFPTAIALDPRSGKLYFADYPSILRCDLDGSNLTLLLSGVGGSGLAVDAGGGKLYWTDGSSKRIRRAELDGSNVEDLITSGLLGPLGIALDLSGGKMYWTDTDYNYVSGGTSKIRRADLNGSNMEDLLTGDINFWDAIALEGNKIYWAQRSANAAIRRANLDGSQVEDVVIIAANRTERVGIAIDPRAPIPAVSQWGLMVMALLLLIAATRILRPRGTRVGCAMMLILYVPAVAQETRNTIHVVRVFSDVVPQLGDLALTPRVYLDYGTFAWVELSSADLARLQVSGLPYEEREEPYTLHLGGQSFDPLKNLPVLPPGWESVGRDGPDLHVIQFVGPTRAEWLDGLERQGLKIVQYIYPCTYVVWGTKAACDAAATADVVR